MIKNKILATLLIGILLLAACNQQTGSAALSAALSELVGKVDLKPADSEAFAPADANSVLQPNGQVQTGDDGKVRLDLSTGTIIRIASSSSFTLTSNEETDGGLITKIKLTAGKVFIILNGGHAEVETPSGVASVRGSYMKVEVDDNGDVYVTCLEGHCSAQNPAGTVEFTEGQKTILFHKDPTTGKWTAPGVEPMSDDDYQDWLDNNPEAKAIIDQANAIQTATALAKPTETSTPEATPTIVSSLPNGGSSTACKLLTPPQGADLENLGKVKFEWEPQPKAVKYVLTITTVGGNTVSFETTETSIEKYIEIFPAEGNYKWDVTAYGDNEEQLCKSPSITFSKPESDYVPPTKKPDEPEPQPTDPPITCDVCNSSSVCFDQYQCDGG